jgi:large subunit ribosomal protein L21
MYGIVEVKGHQYRVKAGDIIDVQKMDAEVGSTVELDQVLFVGGDAPKVGTPVVEGAKVTAEVVRQARSRKIIVFVRKPGRYQKKNGHRQHYTGLKIKEIKA